MLRIFNQLKDSRRTSPQAEESVTMTLDHAGRLVDEHHARLGPSRGDWAEPAARSMPTQTPERAGELLLRFR